MYLASSVVWLGMLSSLGQPYCSLLAAYATGQSANSGVICDELVT